MRFGSVCSGIEAASVAWEPLGWQADWFAEIDEAACKLLNYRFPDVPNHGDMTTLAAKVRAREISAPDILVGGTPCQSFSVAGMRGGLSDSRGQLTIAFIDLADAIDEIRLADGKPALIIIWENVPGVLNHADNPLGCFLAGLAGDDDALEPGPRPEPARSAAFWTWDQKASEHRAKWPNAGCAAGPKRTVAWRTLDAQYFGLAQRRRRVFVVASAREGFDPGAVLLEFGGVRRDSAPRRATGESIAATLDARTDGGGFPGTDGACGGHVVSSISGDSGVAVDPLTGEPVPQWWDGRPVSQTLDAVLQPVTVVHGTQNPITLEDMALPLGRNSGQENAICYAIQERAICENPDAGPDGVGVRSDDCAYTMEARTVPQAVAYQAIGFAQNQRDEVRLMDVSGALAAEPGMKQTTYVAQPAVHVSPTLRAGGNSTGGDRPPGTDVDTVDSLITTFIDNIVMLVRRLMPVECERLQGFPDEWTRIPIKHYAVRKLTKNRPEDMWIADPNGGWWLTASDGPRYKQLGNSMAVAVMNWIGRRVQMQLIVTDFEDILG